MQAVPNWDFQQQLRTYLSTALSSVLKIQPYMPCPRFHMGYVVTKQGTVLNLCSVPLLQGLWNTPMSACASHSPCPLWDRTGLGASCQQGAHERWWNLPFIFWSPQPAENQLSIRLPSYIQLHRSALAGNWLAWEKLRILSWRQHSSNCACGLLCTTQA